MRQTKILTQFKALVRKMTPYSRDIKEQLNTAVIANLALSLPCGTFVQTVKSNKLIIH